jgi:hypothetical protein
LLAASIVTGAGAGCDQRNLAVITLDGLPSSATAVTDYYQLDGTEWKTIVPQRSLQQFGIELPEGRSAAFATQVFSYANRLPCSLGNAAGATDLDGGSIRELELNVTTTTKRCNAAVEPVDFPQGNMVVWANAASDIWLAGTNGKIVHWDGTAYAKVPLPAQLAQAPPDWNAILGDGPDIWLAGTNSVVAHWTQGVLSVVPILSPAQGPTNWRSMAMGDYDSGEIVLVGTNRILGVANAMLGVAERAFNCGAVTPTGELTAVGCPYGSDGFRCFFVTDRGGIASMQFNTAGMPLCKNISSPTTKGLLDVYVGVNSAAQAYDVRIVGMGGLTLRATTPILGTADPNFMVNADYSQYIPQNARVDFHRVGGSSLDELWIAGQGGILLRWQNTPVGMPSAATFSLSPTGTTTDLSSLSGFGSNLFFSGTSHTLGYIGQLFTPN